MNCNFCNKYAVPIIINSGGKFQTFYQCYRHGSLKVSWKNPEVYAISNGVYRIRNIVGGRFFVDALRPQLQVLMRLDRDPKVNPENFEKKLRTLLVFS